MTPLEIALERIEECRRTRAPALNLSELGLTEIPEQVFELTWLEKLDVSGDWLNQNQDRITEIPMALRQLNRLITFNCSDNQIRDLSALMHLMQLKTLNCFENQIIPSAIENSVFIF